MDKLVAIIGSALLGRILARQTPWVLAIATRLRPGLVRPIRSTPGSTGGTEDAHVVLAALHRTQEVVLLLLVEQIVSGAADEDIDLGKLESDPGVLAELLQSLGDGCLSANS